jgi:hypothetical protein
MPAGGDDLLPLSPAAMGVILFHEHMPNYRHRNCNSREQNDAVPQISRTSTEPVTTVHSSADLGNKALFRGDRPIDGCAYPVVFSLRGRFLAMSAPMPKGDGRARETDQAGNDGSDLVGVVKPAHHVGSVVKARTQSAQQLGGLPER